MSTSKVRVRFAPSPTGFMHLGNVRAALVNYIFAQKNHGAFILRIEDTDPQRNVDPQGMHIMADLAWLGLTYQEGPIIGGPFAPYYQSERTVIYQRFLKALELKSQVYRCFCTTQELEKKRERQIALKMPPRYDRTCLKLSPEQVEQNLAAGLLYIWRFKLQEEILAITDLARGTVQYDLHNFSDFPLTRQDGSFTFIFANFVDDISMEITHIFRGEEHLSNTALQAALYKAFDAEIPTFWHLPLLCSIDGKKLSKRDFGFSLNDLREAGFLPEALDNYLAIIGTSVEHEIMSLPEIIQTMNFDTTHSSGHITYDIKKLEWVNHKWILKLTPLELAERCHSYILRAYPEAQTIQPSALAQLLQYVQSEMITLADSVKVLEFYFRKPLVTDEILAGHKLPDYKDFLHTIISKQILSEFAPDIFVSEITAQCKAQKIPAKEIFALLRVALTGYPHGPSIKDIVTMLQPQEALHRLQRLV